MASFIFLCILLQGSIVGDTNSMMTINHYVVKIEIPVNHFTLALLPIDNNLKII